MSCNKSYRVVGEIPTLQSLAFFELLVQRRDCIVFPRFQERTVCCMRGAPFHSHTSPCNNLTPANMKPLMEIINPQVFPMWMWERLDKWTIGITGNKCSLCGRRKLRHKRSYALMEKRPWGRTQWEDVYNCNISDE